MNDDSRAHMSSRGFVAALKYVPSKKKQEMMRGGVGVHGSCGTNDWLVAERNA